MTFKLITTILATATVAGAVQWTSDIPVNAHYVIGSEFPLEWVPEDTTATFQLRVNAWNNTPSGYTSGPWFELPIYDSKTMILDKKVPISDGIYRWVVQAVDPAWQGDGFYYTFVAEYFDPYYSTSSPRAFHIVN